MSCQQIRDLLDAYLDQELDVLTSARVEEHLTGCAECRSMYGDHKRMRDGVVAGLSYFPAPDALEEKVRASLRASGTARAHQAALFLPWKQWSAVAAAFAGILLISALLLRTPWTFSGSEQIAHEVVSSHIRSLLADHLNDVASTDQHTVKPWFSGRLDFAPQVKDLSRDGFPLIGGRLDYINNRPVAALVYKRRQHTINLFTWPSSARDCGPRRFSERGYHVVEWTRSHMTYWAVSDASAADLDAFARNLQQ